MNILQVSTYPIEKPLHGGQIRVFEISNKLKEIGFNVKSVSFTEPSHNYFNEKNDIIINPTELNQEIKTVFSADLATSIVTDKAKKYYNFLINHIDEFEPDYIFIEQCWLWPLIKKIKSQSEYSKIKIVYSSQNVEYLTKESLFESNKINDNDDVVNKIKLLEIDLLNSADAVITCTDDDAKHYKTISNATNVFICPNGVSKKNINPNTLIHLKNVIGDRKFALFVGSAYPPNAQGFWHFLGGNMAWLKPNEMIIAVGGCSKILESFQPKEFEINSFVNFDKIKRLGFVEEDELAALIELSSVIILPINSGGGSNLKTAEAIISGKPVVSTKMACRGFNNCENYSNYSIVENKSEFIESVKFYLRNKTSDFSFEEKNLRSFVSWDYALDNLKDIF